MKRAGYALIALLFACMVKSGIAMDTLQPTEATSVQSPAPEHSRLWNLQNADILSIINQVSLETGKNFVVDPRVSGKISLISSKPVKPSEVYDIFLSVLELLGYSAINSGHVVKIVPNMESGEFATPVATANRQGHHDEVMVRILPLERVSAAQLIPVIRPFLPQWSNISAYTPGNVIILLGRSANLDRIVKIIHQIDQNASSDVDIVQLREASAAQMVTVLTRLQNSTRAAGDAPQVSFAADERSNSILLAGNKSARLHLKYLISKLDTPAGKAEGNTEVIYLRYLQAKTFAPLLGKIALNMQGKNSGGDTSSRTDSSVNTTGPAGKSAGTPELQTNVQAELSTNAIIITAPPDMMRALKAVVTKLDIRPAEVLVEGIIVEVNQDDLRSLGIRWGTLTQTTNTNTSDVTTPVTVLTPGIVGLIPNSNIAAILNFLETRNDANILSTPSVSVLDNHKAKLEIGQTVPEETGSYATTGSATTATPFNTFQDKKVALTLEVVPQINLNTAVRLEIKLNNDSLQNPEDPGDHPIVNTSSIQNSVIINSGDVLVLGGLISNSSTVAIHKVPILGDIPIVGKLLFQSKGHKIQKKNLLVFIKPTIVHTSEDANILTRTKYQFIRERQIKWPEDIVSNTPEHAPNVLPLWEHDPRLPTPFNVTDNHSP
ncbi:MAG: type II secretion system secretin GspD [Gammaproteobacteria bacterium]|nr:type II secretion system secretin GspD [Gammaproteobacteria bacterium]